MESFLTAILVPFLGLSGRVKLMKSNNKAKPSAAVRARLASDGCFATMV